MALTLTAKKDESIIIGNHEDNKDIRIEFINKITTDDGEMGAWISIREPKGERQAILLLHEKIQIGPAKVEFVGTRTNGVVFSFDAPKDIPINRDEVFHSKAHAIEEERKAKARGDVQKG